MSPSPSLLEPVAIIDNAYTSTLAFVDSLGRHRVPLHVYGATTVGVTRWSRHAKRYERCPPLDRPDEFVPWLRAQIRAGHIKRVAPTSDLLAFYLAELRDEFPPEVRDTIPTLIEIENCLFKSRFASTCLDKGIHTPATASPTTLQEALSFAESVGYPLVLKAKSHIAVGMTERGTVIENATQLRERFAPFSVNPGHESLAKRYPELLLPLLQQYIPTAGRRVYSVSGFKHPTLGILSAAVSYKCEQWPPNVGISTHQVGSASQQILDLGMMAVDQFISAGIFELELLIDGDRLLAIDLNPRAFGFMHLDIARGNDLPWLWYQATVQQSQLPSVIQLLPVMESRQALPFFISRMMMLLRGPERMQQAKSLRTELRRSWISMSGQWRDPLPKLITLLSQLRHPGGLIRPYLRGRRGTPKSSNSMADHTAQHATQPKGFTATQVLATGAYPQLKISTRPVRKSDG